MHSLPSLSQRSGEILIVAQNPHSFAIWEGGGESELCMNKSKHKHTNWEYLLKLYAQPFIKPIHMGKCYKREERQTEGEYWGLQSLCTKKQNPKSVKRSLFGISSGL